MDITKENNPNIIDATNRQDFLDNEEYKALKSFIILQLEALAQCSAPVLLSLPGNKGKLALYAGVDGVRFKNIVRPGDKFEMEIELTKLNNNEFVVDADKSEKTKEAHLRELNRRPKPGLSELLSDLNVIEPARIIQGKSVLSQHL